MWTNNSSRLHLQVLYFVAKLECGVNFNFCINLPSVQVHCNTKPAFEPRLPSDLNDTPPEADPNSMVCAADKISSAPALTRTSSAAALSHELPKVRRLHFLLGQCRFPSCRHDSSSWMLFGGNTGRHKLGDIGFVGRQMEIHMRLHEIQENLWFLTVDGTERLLGMRGESRRQAVLEM